MTFKHLATEVKQYYCTLADFMYYFRSSELCQGHHVFRIVTVLFTKCTIQIIVIKMFPILFIYRRVDLYSNYQVKILPKSSSVQQL